MGSLLEDRCKFTIISCQILRRMRNISDGSCRETEMHILGSELFPEYCAVYEIMCKNVVQVDRSHDSKVLHR